MAFKRGFKSEANRIAVRIRQQMQLDAKDPIDPFAVCAHFDIETLKLSELMQSSPFLTNNKSVFSAVTVPCGIKTMVVYNDAHHFYRQRSNLCHELAHCFLGHQCVPPLTEKGERARDGGMEAEANFLGGSLLITNEAAVHIMMNGIASKAQQLYGVSAPMLQYRLRVSGAQKIYSRRVANGR